MHNFFGSASDITKSYIVYFFCVCQKFDFKRYKYKYLCASPRHSIAGFNILILINQYYDLGEIFKNISFLFARLIGCYLVPLAREQ